MRPLVLAALLLATPAGAQTLVIGNKAENTVSFVDLATGKEVRRVPTGPEPHEVALSPDGRQIAVVAFGGSSIDLFDVASGKRLRHVELGGKARPHGVVWLPDGRILATAEGVDALMIVDAAASSRAKAPGEGGGGLVATGVTAIPTGAEGSHMVAVSADRTRAYVANMGSGTVGVFDLVAGRKLRDVPAGKQPEGMALTADGRRLWVADRMGDVVRVFDTATMKEVARAPTGKTPIRVVTTPDRRYAVVAHFGAGTLGVHDAATARPVRTIRIGEPASQPVTMLFSPEGKLYVAQTGIDRVAEVDLAGGKVLRRLTVGKNGDGFAISPVTAR